MGEADLSPSTTGANGPFAFLFPFVRSVRALDAAGGGVFVFLAYPAADRDADPDREGRSYEYFLLLFDPPLDKPELSLNSPRCI